VSDEAVDGLDRAASRLAEAHGRSAPVLVLLPVSPVLVPVLLLAPVPRPVSLPPASVSQPACSQS
jgi:hypothetical protein